MWMVVDDRETESGVVNQIEGEFADVGVEGMRNLIDIVEQVHPDDVLFILCRREGVPREFDREFWRLARATFDGSDINLVDLIVFNRDRIHSMRAEDTSSHAVA